MKRLLGSAVLALGLASFTPAGAVTLLDVADATPDDIIFAGAGEALAVSFTLNSAVTNFEASAPTPVCVDCSATVWLHANEIGAGASFGDIIGGAQTYTGGTTLFSLTDQLDPGIYFLIVAVDNGSLGDFGWAASVSPTDTETHATNGFDWVTTSADPVPAFSDWNPRLDNDLLYTLTGDLVPDDPVAVPLPASGLLALAGAGLLAGLGRRRRRAG